MCPESSSVNTVNLVIKFTTIPEISNFSYGIIFYWRALYGVGINLLCGVRLNEENL